jgi:hypothetical protein
VVGSFERAFSRVFGSTGTLVHFPSRSTGFHTTHLAALIMEAGR